MFGGQYRSDEGTRECTGVLDGKEKRFKEAKKDKQPLDTGRPCQRCRTNGT